MARIDDPHHCVSISHWRSIEDWREWEASEERRLLNACTAPLLDEPETVIIRTTM